MPLSHLEKWTIFPGSIHLSTKPMVECAQYSRSSTVVEILVVSGLRNIPQLFGRIVTQIYGDCNRPSQIVCSRPRQAADTTLKAFHRLSALHLLTHIKRILQRHTEKCLHKPEGRCLRMTLAKCLQRHSVRQLQKPGDKLYKRLKEDSLEAFSLVSLAC